MAYMRPSITTATHTVEHIETV